MPTSLPRRKFLIFAFVDPGKEPAATDGAIAQ
jgi:hypothetical protein